MFATAVKNFVEEVDHGGLLIPSCSLNDSISLLTVVVKRKRFWFWQKPKCIPTDFTLNDLLTGDAPIQPVVLETDFIKYDQSCGENIQGSVDAGFASSHVNMEGKESVKLKSSFGSLKKEEVDVKKLFCDSKSRVLDMSHSLVQQVMQKKKQIFSVVKERIVNTAPFSVIEEVQQVEACGGMLGFLGPATSKFSLKDNGSLSHDCNVTMEIPAHTTLAYAVLELEVKHDGHYELCLMRDTHGGFETDSHPGLTASDGRPSNDLRSDLEEFHHHFQLLRSLPASTRSSLLQIITQLMEDGSALSALDTELERLRLRKSEAQSDVTTTDSQKRSIQSVVKLLEESGGLESSGGSTSAVEALHLLTSALCELRSDCLTALGSCRAPAEMKFLEQMVCCVSGDERLDLSAAGSPPEDVYLKARHLFSCCHVIVTRDGDAVTTRTNDTNLPLVSCIAVRGLCSLSV